MPYFETRRALLAHDHVNAATPDFGKADTDDFDFRGKIADKVKTHHFQGVYPLPHAFPRKVAR